MTIDELLAKAQDVFNSVIGDDAVTVGTIPLPVTTSRWGKRFTVTVYLSDGRTRVRVVEGRGGTESFRVLFEEIFPSTLAAADLLT